MDVFSSGHTRVHLLTEGEMLLDGRLISKGAVTWDPKALIPIFENGNRIGWARNLKCTKDVISAEVPNHLEKEYGSFTVYLSNLEAEFSPDDSTWLIRSGVIREILVWTERSES